MGRSQYLLNRSKQRFKRVHGGSHATSSADSHSLQHSGGGDDNSSIETPAHTENQGYQYEYQEHLQQHQYHQESGGYPPQQKVPLQRQEERQYQQHHKHIDEVERPNRRRIKAGGERDQADLSWSFSGQTMDEQGLQQPQQQPQHQNFEQQKFEHEQQQLHLRQEQLRQQEQQRWQQHQLQLQQEQLRQQEQMRQMRQQQQIRNQKLHHQQRHQFQMQQKQLREQQKLLEQQYQQQRRDQKEGASRQAEARRQPKEQAKEPEKSKEELREERKKSSRLRKGWWRRQQQLLNQLDDEESLYDLHKTITRPRPPPIGFVSSGGASVSSTQHPNSGEAWEGHMGITIDVRAVSEALTFLDRASRLQIPEHLATTLETFPAMPRGNQEAIDTAIALGQGKKPPSGLYGSDFITLQQSKSASSGLSASYSRHQQNARSQQNTALSNGYMNGLSGYNQQALPPYHPGNVLPGLQGQYNTLPGLGQVELPHYQQNALPAYPKKVASGRYKQHSVEDYDYSGNALQDRFSARSKTSALSVSSSSSRSLEPKSTITDSPRDPYDASDTSYVESAYSSSIKETITKTKAKRHTKPDNTPVRSYGFEPTAHQTVTTMTNTSKIESISSHGMPSGFEGQAIRSGSFQDSYNTPNVRSETPVRDLRTPLHRNFESSGKDSESMTPSPNLLYGLSAYSDMESPRDFTTEGEESALQLTALASPSTLAVSVVTEDQGHTTDEAPSFPSLRITEAFTFPSRKDKDKEKDSQSSSHASRNPAPSPSPSEMLMTYTVTDNGEDSSNSAAKSGSDPSRISSGLSSMHSRLSMLGKPTPPRELKAERAHQNSEAKDSRLPKQEPPKRESSGYESRQRQAEEDTRAPSSQDQGNEPPYLPPSSGRSLMDQRSSGGSRSEDVPRNIEGSGEYRSGSVSREREGPLLGDGPSNATGRSFPPARGPRVGSRTPSLDGDAILSLGGRPLSSAGSRSGDNSMGRDSREPAHDSHNSNEAKVDQLQDHDDLRRRQEDNHKMSKPESPERNDYRSPPDNRTKELGADQRFDDSNRDPIGTGAHDTFTKTQEAELDRLLEPTSSNERSRNNSRSTHTSFYEPIHPYETTRKALKGGSPIGNARSLEDQFAEEPMAPFAASRHRREGAGRQPATPRQGGSSSCYQEPSSTRAVARNQFGFIEETLDRLDERPRYSSDPMDRRDESFRRERTHHTRSSVSSRRPVGQYRHLGGNKQQLAYDLDAPFSSYEEESTTGISELTGRDFGRPSFGHRHTMADYEDASNSIAHGEPTEEDSIFSSVHSQMTPRGAQELDYLFDKGGNESYFLDDPPHSIVRKGGGKGLPSPSSTNMNVNTIRTAYASMAKALGKERYSPVGFPGKKLIRADRHSHSSRGTSSYRKRVGREDEEDLDTWLENAMASKSIDADGCGASVRQFGDGGDEADLDAWLDNVICR